MGLVKPFLRFSENSVSRKLPVASHVSLGEKKFSGSAWLK